MLKNNQDFSAVELELKKYKSVTIGQRKAGQWVTKHHLMNTLNWTKNHACNHAMKRCISKKIYTFPSLLILKGAN